MFQKGWVTLLQVSASYDKTRPLVLELADNYMYSVDWLIDRLATTFNISGKKIHSNSILLFDWFDWVCQQLKCCILNSGDLTVCAVVGDKVMKNLEAKGALEEDGDESTQKDFAWKPFKLVD